MSDTESLARYKAFVTDMVLITAGRTPGPPPEDLCAAIEDGTVNMVAVAAMISGIPFESYTEPPQSWPAASASAADLARKAAADLARKAAADLARKAAANFARKAAADLARRAAAVFAASVAVACRRK